jgi:hypothetical protein
LYFKSGVLTRALEVGENADEKKRKKAVRWLADAHKIIGKCFPEETTLQERDSVIDSALEKWCKKHPSKKTCLF